MIYLICHPKGCATTCWTKYAFAPTGTRLDSEEGWHVSIWDSCSDFEERDVTNEENLLLADWVSVLPKNISKLTWQELDRMIDERRRKGNGN